MAVGVLDVVRVGVPDGVAVSVAVGVPVGRIWAWGVGGAVAVGPLQAELASRIAIARPLPSARIQGTPSEVTERGKEIYLNSFE